jgi:hypothetical protein
MSKTLRTFTWPTWISISKRKKTKRNLSITHRKLSSLKIALKYRRFKHKIYRPIQGLDPMNPTVKEELHRITKAIFPANLLITPISILAISLP